MRSIRLVGLSAYLLVTVLTASASSASVQESLKITRLSVRIERHIDGYVRLAFRVSLSKGMQPIKSLLIGQPLGVEYQETRDGVDVTSAGKKVAATGRLITPGGSQGKLKLTFSHPTATARVVIASPSGINCAAGVATPVAEINVSGVDASGAAISSAIANTSFTFVKAPAWWRPTHKQQMAVC